MTVFSVQEFTASIVEGLNAPRTMKHPASSFGEQKRKSVKQSLTTSTLLSKALTYTMKCAVQSRGVG